MTRHALYLELKAKPGMEEELASFLISGQALAADEPATTAWFAVRFDKQSFAIFDAFEDEAGREAHLNGPLAEALMARAPDLIEGTPNIRRPDVLADKLPG